jgi:hypothetical protein
VDFEERQSSGSGTARGKGRRLFARLGLLTVRLALDALLIDAAIETWLAGSPTRLWVVAAVAVYVALVAWALFQGSRLAAPGLVTQTPAPFYLLLALLVATTSDRAGFTHGIVMLKQSTPMVLCGVAVLLVWLAVYRVAVLRGAWVWFRLAILALGVYATWAFGVGMLHGTPYWDLMHGHGQWSRLPYWGQGALVGSLGLVPAAFVRELGVSMAKVRLTGYLRWMLIFALGAWIAINAVTL